MIDTISFYDFDGTLLDTLDPETGKKIYKDKTGEDYPYKGWWGRKESLDCNIFNFDVNDSVYSKYIQDYKSEKIKTVLLTNRLYKLKDFILKVLNTKDIVFDEYSFKKGSKDKVERILDIIGSNNNIKTINIYDDRDKELKEFEKFKKEYTDKFNINVYKIKNNVLVETEKNKIINMITEEIKRFI